MKQYEGRAFLRVWWRTMGGESAWKKLVGFANEAALFAIGVLGILVACGIVGGAAAAIGAGVYWLAVGFGASMWVVWPLTLVATLGGGYTTVQTLRVFLYSEQVEEERQKILEQKGEDGNPVKGAITMEVPDE